MYWATAALILVFSFGCDLLSPPKEPATGFTEFGNIGELYESYFPIGAAVSGGEYGTNSFTYYPANVVSVFSSFVAENCMKPALIQPEEGTFEWDAADVIVDAAEARGAVVRGHTLVWHSQSPAWMTAGTKEEARARMRAHILAVAGRYTGRISAWDVVNEAVTDYGYRTDSPWYTVYGDASYIQDAFDYAYEADPDAKLFYNDYGVVNASKRNTIKNMITELRLKEDHHLAGVGIQAHWNLNWPSLSEIQATIDTFSDMGLEVQFTELDIDVYGGDGSIAETVLTDDLDEALADRYGEIFALFRQNAEKITNVTFWGIADDHTWLNRFWDSTYHNDEFRQNYPMPFNTNHEAKRLYMRITDF